MQKGTANACDRHGGKEHHSQSSLDGQDAAYEAEDDTQADAQPEDHVIELWKGLLCPPRIGLKRLLHDLHEAGGLAAALRAGFAPIRAALLALLLARIRRASALHASSRPIRRHHSRRRSLHFADRGGERAAD
eukprot:scaffold1026_cov272-Pinguiococcus_pyrenoidosus.AAC.8